MDRQTRAVGHSTRLSPRSIGSIDWDNQRFIYRFMSRRPPPEGESMRSAGADRNLLFGVIAQQGDVITRIPLEPAYSFCNLGQELHDAGQEPEASDI